MSFSSEIKDSLVKSDIKNGCCALAELYFLHFFYYDCAETAETDKISRFIFLMKKAGFRKPEIFEVTGKSSSSYKMDFSEVHEYFKSEKREDILKKDCCERSFLKAAFYQCGTVSAPSLVSRLEFNCPDNRGADIIKNILGKYGIVFTERERFQKKVIYMSRRQCVSDTLALFGAIKEKLVFDNYTVERDVNNSVNRAINCDNNNVNSSLAAAERQLKAIEALRANDALKELSPALYETAILREKYPEYTLSELSEVHMPPITRGGVAHRLNQIIEKASIYLH